MLGWFEVGFAVLLVPAMLSVWIIVGRRSEDRWPSERSAADAVTRNAIVVADVLAPAGRSDEKLSTSELTDVAQRTEQLALNAAKLATAQTDVHTKEALEDVRQVAIRLGAALDGELLLRGGHLAGGPAVTRSRSRIAERATELDLAARELAACAVGSM